MSGIDLDERGLPKGYPFQEDWEVTPREVREKLAGREEGERFVLVDCRTPGEWETARIEGAELVPMNELSSRLADLESHLDDEIVVYCHHGMRSLRVAAALRGQGFADVRSMAGGIDLWSLDVDPKVPRY